MNMERPPVKAVPEAGRYRFTPQSAPSKAVPECVEEKGPTFTRRNPIAAKAHVAWPAGGSAA